MLPFTKRPGRGDAVDVVTKEDSPKSSASVPPPASNVKRSVPPPALSSRPIHDMGDEDEMTSVMPSRSYTGPIPPNKVLPAAGTPAIPPSSHSRPASVRPLPQPVPPSSSARGQLDDSGEDDDDEGRTVVRGAPKIVKRANVAKKSSMPPTSISPAAVIKATLESARANRRELLPGPPADLLEDRSDFERSEPPGFDRKDQLEFDRDRKDLPDSRKEAPFERSAPVRSHQQPAAFARTLPASTFENPPAPRPPLEGPPSYPPPAHYGQSHLGAKPANAPYGAAPQVVPPAPASVPAHFMTPQAPYSADPPGTAVTSNSRVVGRPATSWAVALLACGLFVGVAAVAVMQSSESVADTTASFVDPSRAPRSNSAQQQQQQQQAAPPTPVPVTPAAVPVPDPNAPAGLIGASPVAPPPVAPPAAPPEDPAAQVPVAAPVAAPIATAPVVTAPVVTPPVATAPVVTAPAASPQGTVVGGFAPVTVPAASPASQAAPPKKPAWTWRPPPPAPAKPVAKAADDEPKKEKATKAAEKPGKKANGDADDETRKALEALQKAQLESASSFGKD